MTLMALAMQGLGLAYLFQREAEQAGQGMLEAALGDWIAQSNGVDLYFPARTQGQPKLRALLDLVKSEGLPRDHG